MQNYDLEALGLNKENDLPNKPTFIITDKELLVTTMRRLSFFEGTKISIDRIENLEIIKLEDSFEGDIISVQGPWELFNKPVDPNRGQFDIWGG